MELVFVKNKADENRFLKFRKELYSSEKTFVDNNYFMLREVFGGKTSFIKDKDIFPVFAVENGRIVCQCVIVYAKELPEYIQMCFFESLPDKLEAVEMIVNAAAEKGRERNCIKIVSGLNGHVNYGLGFLNSHFDDVNSFSAGSNPEYYCGYFKALGFSEIKLNTYIVNDLGARLGKYEKLAERLGKNYTFRNFGKKQFKYYSKLFTDLNNICFEGHRYYYKRTYCEDEEMLRELFLFMKEESLIYAFKGDEPAGFILWYPDYNELAERGESFGTKHFFRNIFLGRKIKTAKIVEFGVLEEHRRTGLPMALVGEVYKRAESYNFTRAETSWVLDENKDSNSVCAALCEEKYKEYVSFEKDIKECAE